VPRGIDIDISIASMPAGRMGTAGTYRGNLLHLSVRPECVTRSDNPENSERNADRDNSEIAEARRASSIHAMRRGLHVEQAIGLRKDFLTP
jgi:hypothetical protein